MERAALVGADRQHVFSLLQLATLLLDALRLDDAQAIIGRLSESLERLDSDEARYACCAREAELCLARGRHQDALAVIDRGLALAARYPRHQAGFQVLRAEAFLGLHRTEEAYAEAVEARSALVAVGADADAEEALALAARALRLSGRCGPERDELRSVDEPRTFTAALERLLDAESLSERDRWRAAAERLARHARWRAELAASVA